MESGSAVAIDMELKIVPHGKILDYIDESFRQDTPEEYVRQTVEKRLVNEHGYARNRIKVEFTLRIGTRRPRADLVIFPESAPSFSQEHIQVIIECKSEKIEPNNKKEGVEQLKSYMAACVNCEWGMWTNGKFKAVYRKIRDVKGAYTFIDFNDIPPANGQLDSVDRPLRKQLRSSVDDNLLFVFRTCHNHIYANDGMQKQPAFFELLKVIFCKIEDERNATAPLEFYATSAERSNPDGQLTIKNRISKIFEKVKKRYGKIFEQSEVIKLSPRSLSYIVAELQPYSLLNTNIDIKGKAYEEIVGSNLRGDRGEFFTPRNVARMAVKMLNPRADERILDPACGTGGFLVLAMNGVIEYVKEELARELGKPEQLWALEEWRIVQEKTREIAQANFFGFDINPDLVKATKMNMVMNNDGSGNILHSDSLLHPHEWKEEFRQKLAEALSVEGDEFRSPSDIAFFDVIVTNPPFGSKIPIKDAAVLAQYDLGHIWTSRDGRWTMTNRLQSSVPPEQLFIERCYQFLKPGGRMAIVLPDSILGSPGLGYIRQWLIEKTRIVASVDLHPDTFQPRNGTNTSVLVLQKKEEKLVRRERESRQVADYQIFMAIVDKVGQDKRGNPIFKRDPEGNEILASEETSMIETSGSGFSTVRMLSKARIRDDQTSDVYKVFRNWAESEVLGW